MSITVLTDASVKYAGVDLSDHVESVMVDMSSDEVDVTAMGAQAHAIAPGLRQDAITINFFQDFAATKVDATLSTYQGSATGATIQVKPTSATVSATNPEYKSVMTPFTYHPLDGAVGSASQTSVTFRPVAGTFIVRGTV